MEIIRQKINQIFYGKVIKVDIVSFNINYLLYSIKLENETIVYHKEHLNSSLDKYIFFEIINNSLLWTSENNCIPHQTYGFKLEIIIKLEIDLIDEYKDKSYGLNYFLLNKNNHLPVFVKFNEDTSYLPSNEMINPSDNFKIKLYDYQKKSLNKMIQIENKKTEFTINYSSEITFLNKKFNFDPVKGVLSDKIRSFKIKI